MEQLIHSQLCIAKIHTQTSASLQVIPLTSILVGEKEEKKPRAVGINRLPGFFNFNAKFPVILWTKSRKSGRLSGSYRPCAMVTAAAAFRFPNPLLELGLDAN
jgi:hypothetical protein